MAPPPPSTLALRAAGAVWCVLGAFVVIAAVALQQDIVRNLIAGVVLALPGAALLVWPVRRPRRAVAIVAALALVVGAGLLAAAGIRVFGEGYAVFG